MHVRIHTLVNQVGIVEERLVLLMPWYIFRLLAAQQEHLKCSTVK